MGSEWTAKQVRKQANLEYLSASNSKTGDMLTAYAERIEADERAVAIWQYRRTSDTQWLDCDELDADAWKQTGLHEVRKLFTHPPAQAAQSVDVGKVREVIAEPVAQDDWRIGFFEGLARAAREKGYAGIAEAIYAAPTAPSPGESV